jgi:pimeloyl-ACP methyl ester carboxylesterase
MHDVNVRTRRIRGMHRRDADAYAASRRRSRSFAAVSGRRVAYVDAGAGAPAIVFVSGAGMDIDSWFKVFPAVSGMSRAIAYDRLGVGQSDRPTAPQAGEVIVDTLRELLQQIEAAAPHVLVGHSLGGLHVELYARRHPEEVAGVVLVEAASPEEAADPPRGDVIARGIGGIQAAIDRMRGQHGLAEMDVVPETVRQVRAAPPFPDVPLVVVTGGQRMRMVPEAAFEAHQAAQRGRVALSAQGRQVIAEGSGHFPQLHEPEIVIEAIREVAQRAGP